MQRHKRILLFLLLALCALLLSGCAQNGQVENQAYGLAMGLDREPDGQLRLMMKIPKISGGSSNEGSGSGGGSDQYMQLEVTGKDFQEALEKLNWAAPRALNLSHLKLILFSEELARSPEMRQLISDIAQTEHLFTAACVSVCADKAKDFISALEPAMGQRLSSDLEATLEHDANMGFIPESYLSDLYYRTESVYSDPMAGYALLNKSKEQKSGSSGGGSGGEQSATTAFAFEGSAQEVSKSNESQLPTRYLGAAVFADGQLQGVFTPKQTMMTSLIRNSLDSMTYSFDNQSVTLMPVRGPMIQVDLKQKPIKIKLSLRLAIYAQDRAADEEALARSLEKDLQEAFRAAQTMGAEPFGFAERAAAKFLTLEDWMAYDWRSRFQEAELEVEFHFSKADA